MEGDRDRELLSDSDPPSPSLSPPPRPLSLTSFDRERHVTFLEMMYHMLPCPYQSQEINHLTLAYFVVSGLDILDALDRVHKDAVADWVLSFQAHPRSEADLGNGGAAYCAIASLRLMGFIGDDCLTNASALSSKASIRSLLDWSLQRQVADGGLQGRPNKASDTCYAFWIGATMGTLGANKFIDERGLRSFLLTCQSEYGGFSKFPEELPDLYHSYYGIAAFSILGEAGLKPLRLELGVTEAAATGV